MTSRVTVIPTPTTYQLLAGLEPEPIAEVDIEADNDTLACEQAYEEYGDNTTCFAVLVDDGQFFIRTDDRGDGQWLALYHEDDSQTILEFSYEQLGIDPNHDDGDALYLDWAWATIDEYIERELGILPEYAVN